MLYTHTHTHPKDHCSRHPPLPFNNCCDVRIWTCMGNVTGAKHVLSPNSMIPDPKRASPVWEMLAFLRHNLYCNSGKVWNVYVEWGLWHKLYIQIKSIYLICFHIKWALSHKTHLTRGPQTLKGLVRRAHICI